jgi:hypothetical protein
VATVFDFTIASEDTFPAQKVALDRFEKEIRDSSITVALASVAVSAGNCQVVFRADLSEDEIVVLSELVKAHSGESLVPLSQLVTLNGPKDSDLKPIVTISPATEGFVTWICGAGDDLNPTPPDSGRGTGDPFLLSFTALEIGQTKTADFCFIEPIEIHDGQVCWAPLSAWGPNDSFSLGLRIPATELTYNGSGTGNCNKMEIVPNSGMHIIVPAANDGAFDVDLTTAAPVEDREGSGGYWDNDYLTGAISPSTVPGAGRWNLFDFEVKGWLIKNIRMTNPMGVFDIDVYKIEYFHPSWYLHWEVTKNTPGAGAASGWVFCFRSNVT